MSLLSGGLRWMHSLCLVGVVGLFITGELHARSGAPPTGRTGGPMDSGTTCFTSGCHSTATGALESPSTGISVQLGMDNYTPGATHTVTVQVTDAAANTFGFELAAVYGADNQQAGNFPFEMDATNGVINQTVGTIQYIGHYLSPRNTGTWTFSWVAPTMDVGTVTFYITANAANGDGGRNGDRIHVSSAQFSPALVSGISELTTLPEEFRLDQNYPNPFNPSTNITYQLPQGAPVQLTIYNILGREVKILIHGYRDAGHHTAIWDGSNNQGVPVAGGVYIYRLQAGTHATAIRRMLYLK
jgi:hypothetical protein